MSKEVVGLEPFGRVKVQTKTGVNSESEGVELVE